MITEVSEGSILKQFPLKPINPSQWCLNTPKPIRSLVVITIDNVILTRSLLFHNPFRYWAFQKSSKFHGIEIYFTRNRRINRRIMTLGCPIDSY